MILNNADDLNIFFAKSEPSEINVKSTRRLINYLLESSQSFVLITTRNNRINKRLESKKIPIIIEYMNL